MIDLPYIREFTVDDDLINFFENKLDHYKTTDYGFHAGPCPTLTMTFNGFQTHNITELQEEDLNQKLTSFKKKLESQCGVSLEYSWGHMIEYHEHGRQEEHDHAHLEDFSVIIYLNSCDDGETVFKLNQRLNTVVHVPPKRGHAVMFSGTILHSGMETNQNKKIVVFGFRLK